MKPLADFLKNHRGFSLIAALAVLLVALSILAPWIAPHDPLKTNLAQALQGRSREFPLGTDQLGRCLCSRIMVGAGTSLKMMFSLLAIVFAAGTLLGIAAGYGGGKTDAVIMRISDVFLAFPGLVLAIAIVGVLGASLMNTVIALAATSWSKYARVSRSMVLSVLGREYIDLAKMGGAKPGQIIMKYIFPNIVPPLIVMAAMDLGTFLLEISGLSFLGLGAQPPAPEWGFMLSEGRNFMQTAPGLMVYPGMALFITVAIFNLLGDGLRDLLDPQQEQ